MNSKHSNIDIAVDPLIDLQNEGYPTADASELGNAGRDNSTKGRIGRSLLASPLIGSNLNLSRDHTAGREINL